MSMYIHKTIYYVHVIPPIPIQADFADLIEYLPLSEQDGLETSVLGLRFQVEPKHFPSGILELKCTATIGNGYWVTKKMVSQATINAQPSSPGHNRLLAGNTLSPFLNFLSCLLYI